MSASPNPNGEADQAIEPDDINQKIPRIQYADDVETGARRGRLARRDSTDSMSIRSISRRRNVDQATLIPIEYRTV
jgi:hypothetical protein